MSQNVRFRGAVPDDQEYDNPRGYALARELRQGFAARGWTVGEIDNWRDCGWEIRCARARARLIVVFTDEVLADRAWLAQISAEDTPGLLRRTSGRTASATPADMYALAVDLHELLDAGGFAAQRWAWDGPPEDDALARPPTP